MRIKEIRKSSKKKLQRKYHKLLWQYENKCNPSKTQLKKIIQIFKQKTISCDKLEFLLNNSIFWDKIIEIKVTRRRTQVYDLTIPKASNFIANGFIVHNSTAMNMVGCLDIPTKGDVYLENKNISSMTESDLAQIRGKKIGFIFQQFNLISTLSALENVMLPMTFQGTQADIRRRKAIQLLDLVDLKDRMLHKPSEMSGGQQQRVAIARSLANDPEIILADEPTGNLDSKTGGSVMDFLKKLNKKEGKTVVMVTHDEDIANHAQRIIYLKDGVVVKTYKGKKHK